MTTGLCALHGICAGYGYGYEIDSSDVISAYDAFSNAARQTGMDVQTANLNVVEMIRDTPLNAAFVSGVLKRQLGSALQKAVVH